MLLELTVPWESKVEELHVYRLAKNEDLVAVLQMSDYRGVLEHPTRIFTLELAARGLV